MPGAFAVVGVALGVGLWLVVESFLPGDSDSVPPASSKRPPMILRKVRSLLAEAGHPRVDPLVFLITVLIASVAVGVIVVVIVPIPVLSVLSALAMVLAGFAYIRKQREARFHRLQQAWPGVIDHLRAGIRSGSDVTTALMALPDTLPSEITRPVTEFRANIRRGYDTDQALGELSATLANPLGIESARCFAWPMRWEEQTFPLSCCNSSRVFDQILRCEKMPEPPNRGFARLLSWHLVHPGLCCW